MTTRTAHAEIIRLIHRFFRALDKREFDEDRAHAYFTDDVRTATPIGAAEGVEATRHLKEAIERYARTQHIASGILIDVDPGTGRATASWNALMTHVHHESTLRARGTEADPLFTVGGFYETELRHTTEGWRIRGMSVDAIWTTGQPPTLPADLPRTTTP